MRFQGNFVHFHEVFYFFSMSSAQNIAIAGITTNHLHYSMPLRYQGRSWDLTAAETQETAAWPGQITLRVVAKKKRWLACVLVRPSLLLVISSSFSPVLQGRAFLYLSKSNNQASWWSRSWKNIEGNWRRRRRLNLPFEEGKWPEETDSPTGIVW